MSASERWSAFKADSTSLDKLCRHIANGGTLPEFCTSRDLAYADVAFWIKLDAERQQLYTQALEARDEWFKDALIDQLRAVAIFDIRALYDADGRLHPMDQWPAAAAQCVSSVEHNVTEARGHLVKVRCYDKLKAIELLGKTKLKLFVDRHEQNLGEKSLEALLAASRQPTTGGGTG